MHLLIKSKGAKFDPELVRAFYQDNTGTMYLYDGKVTKCVRPGDEALEVEDEYVLWCSTFVHTPFSIGKDIKWLCGPNVSFAITEEGEYINSMLVKLSEEGALALFKFIRDLDTGTFLIWKKGKLEFDAIDMKKYGGWYCTKKVPKNKAQTQERNGWVPNAPGVGGASNNAVYTYDKAEFVVPKDYIIQEYALRSEVPNSVKMARCQVRHMPHSCRLKVFGLEAGDLIVGLHSRTQDRYSPEPTEVQSFFLLANFETVKIRIFRYHANSAEPTELMVLMHPALTRQPLPAPSSPAVESTTPALTVNQRNWIFRCLADNNNLSGTDRETYITQLQYLDDESLLNQSGAAKCGWDLIKN